jgi:drug/metabolite transporter (DMT)-like permease
MAGVGIALIVYEGGGAGAHTNAERALGIALALSSGLGVSLHFIVMRHMSTKVSLRQKYTTLDFLTRSYTYAALMFVGMSVLEGQPLPPLSNWHAWAGVVGMAVITQGLGHTAQNASLRHIRASVVGFCTLLEPLVASILAAVAFGELIGWQGAVGGVLVLISLAFALGFTTRAEAVAQT